MLSNYNFSNERNVLVKLSFINKKGERKNVQFYMDKLTYEALNDKSVTEQMRQQYLVDEYHEILRERNRSRKFCDVDEVFLKNIEYECEELSNPGKYDDLHMAISMLTDRQREFVHLKFYENKTQEEIAQIYGISKQSVSDSMRRIYASLKKQIQDN